MQSHHNGWINTSNYTVQCVYSLTKDYDKDRIQPSTASAGSLQDQIFLKVRCVEFSDI